MKGGCFRGLMLSAILISLTACGTIEFSRHAGPPEETLPGPRPRAERPAPSPPEAKEAISRREIHRSLEAENYSSALNLLRKEIKKGMSETGLAEEYGRAVNGLLALGERYQDQDLPEKAGALFRSAHDGFPETEEVAKQVKFTPSEILARIDACTAELMERGLVAYRAGDLDAAITTWEAVQTFAPRHRASRKALETARVQRDNLGRVDALK